MKFKVKRNSKDDKYNKFKDANFTVFIEILKQLLQ